MTQRLINGYGFRRALDMMAPVVAPSTPHDRTMSAVLRALAAAEQEKEARRRRQAEQSAPPVPRSRHDYCCTMVAKVEQLLDAIAALDDEAQLVLLGGRVDDRLVVAVSVHERLGRLRQLWKLLMPTVNDGYAGDASLATFHEECALALAWACRLPSYVLE